MVKSLRKNQLNQQYQHFREPKHQSAKNASGWQENNISLLVDINFMFNIIKYQINNKTFTDFNKPIRQGNWYQIVNIDGTSILLIECCWVYFAK